MPGYMQYVNVNILRPYGAHIALLLWMACALWVAACASATPGQRQGSPTSPTSAADRALTKHILFLNFAISVDSVAEREHIDLVGHVLRKGALKQRRHKRRQTLFPGWLACTVRSEQGDSLAFAALRHPLDLLFETGDEAGNIRGEAVRLERSEFSLRFQYTPSMHRIDISRIREDLSLERLQTIPIPHIGDDR